MIIRQIKDKILHIWCIICLLISFSFLFSFVGSLLYKSYHAFYVYKINLQIQPTNKITYENDLSKKIDLYHKLIFEKFQKIDANVQMWQIASLINNNSLLDNDIKLHNHAINKKPFWVLVSGRVDQYLRNKAEIKLDPTEITFIENLLKHGFIKQSLNLEFFENIDSSDPQMAGIKTALYGSLMTVLLCLLISLPIGIISSIYLNLFIPKKLLFELIRINISNLATIPSIVYGLIGFFLFLNILNLPRSSIVVASLTLSLLAIPIITVVTDRAIKNLDQNIINASYAMGSSKMQTLFNHIIPMATPSIITGTIIAISRVVGETAPLLMIGMVAYITLPPTNIFSPSTTIPVQIYTWANNPNPLFAEKASIAILILLVLLALFNISANIIRKKYDLHSL